jgi:hypothetical protein
MEAKGWRQWVHLPLNSGFALAGTKSGNLSTESKHHHYNGKRVLRKDVIWFKEPLWKMSLLP